MVILQDKATFLQLCLNQPPANTLTGSTVLGFSLSDGLLVRVSDFAEAPTG